MHADAVDRFEMTLDPPGKIVVIGAGPLGLEAAIYGRFLGYEVEVYEQGLIGQSLRDAGDTALPMLPDRCLSPLAVSALRAQTGSVALASDSTFPMTTGQWVERGLLKIAATDLLSDRVHVQSQLISITHVPDSERQMDEFDETGKHETADEEDSYIEGEVPPDFRLTIRTASGLQTLDAEAVIVAIGAADRSTIEGLEPLLEAPYLFEVGRLVEGDEESDLHRGWREITLIYAGLAGRQALDLYRPLRS